MAKGDTKTNQYLDIAANGTRADFPASCCETRSQTLIREVGERIMDLEDEVERLENNPDVADIVATYADLQSYDTSQLTDKDIIRVLQDETHDGDSTYYRWSTSTNTWTYIGESKQYTDFVGTDGTTAGTAGLVPAPATTDTDKYLKSDGTWAEVQGGGGGTSNFNQLTNRPSYDNTTMTGSTSIPKVPTATSELTNDSGFITSSALPTVNDATLTITQNGTSKGTFTANDADDTTIALTDTTYSDFTGTDGSSAGAAGLVPAPATTDAGKFLKADGTWDTAGGSITPVQTTGTSTTDVMSQNAVTSMIFADPATMQKIKIGAGASTNEGTHAVEIGEQSSAIGDYSIALGYEATVSPGATYGVSIGGGSVSKTNGIAINGGAHGKRAIAIGGSTYVDGENSIGLGVGATTSTKGVMSIETTNYSSTGGYNNSQYRLLTGVYDGQSEHDAATYGQVISYSAINGAGAPTTATEGKYVGQLYYDTTNEAMYFLKTIDTTTTPSTYTWEALGGGGGGGIKELSSADYNYPTASPDRVALWLLDNGLYTAPAGVMLAASTTSYPWYNTTDKTILVGGSDAYKGIYTFLNGNTVVVTTHVSDGTEANTYTLLKSTQVLQATGQSTTDVMSQNAATSMVFADPVSKQKVQIGSNSYSGGAAIARTTAVGTSTQATANRAVAVGDSAQATALSAVAVGRGSLAAVQGQFDIGDQYNNGYSNSAYRLLTGLYDGQNAHDAVTVGQVNATIDAINTALSTNIPHIGA